MRSAEQSLFSQRPRTARSKTMHSFFRFGTDYRVEVELAVKLNFKLGRLADLIQVLAHSDALITDLDPDRSHYSLGLGEAATRVKFRIRNRHHRDQVFKAIRDRDFWFDVVSEA
jgi:(p)ppGpp synthase/HD superfamily hydrolase